MGFYDAVKDVLNVAQKADNLELYRQLLDLTSQALDLQEENNRLKREIEEFKKQRINEEKIERHRQPYLTLKDDPLQLWYCGLCWDRDRKLIQMRLIKSYNGNDRNLYCHCCQQNCYIDNV